MGREDEGKECVEREGGKQGRKESDERERNRRKGVIQERECWRRSERGEK